MNSKPNGAGDQWKPRRDAATWPVGRPPAMAGATWSSPFSPDPLRMLVLRLLVLASAVLAVFLLLTSAEADEPRPPSATHVVAAGETLWQIASVFAPAGSDLRRTVGEIVELNRLDDATIYPGQTIQIP